jgi:hypothetical protein
MLAPCSHVMQSAILVEAPCYTGNPESGGPGGEPQVAPPLVACVQEPEALTALVESLDARVSG